MTSPTSVLVFAAIVAGLLSNTLAHAQGPWPNHGGGLENRREAPLGSKVSKSNVNKLALKWKFNASNEITATPAIADGVIYFPVWTDGNVYAVNAASGKIIWKINIAKAIGKNGTWVRPTPVITKKFVIVGIYGPGIVAALYKTTGKLAWSKVVDPHPYAEITMSGTAYKGAFYVGVSSSEEQHYGTTCCTFRGNFVKMDINTGAILWRTYMVPENNGTVGGFSGGALWGSSPSIDAKRNSVYIATGNVYSVPPSVLACQERNQNKTVKESCVVNGDYEESVLALDLTTGAVKWATNLGGVDVYNNDCKHSPAPYCPPLAGSDYDFGEAPMMLSVKVNGSMTDVVALAAKSGVAWLLTRDAGVVVWASVAGPGATPGGASWGSATDGERIYVNILNSKHKAFTLRPGTGVIYGGGWVGMNATTGEVVWTTAVPLGWPAHGPMTVSNGLVLAGAGGPPGGFYGLDALTGKIVWQYPSLGTVWGGFSADKSCAYVGSGVNTGSIGANTTAGQTIYAFCG